MVYRIGTFLRIFFKIVKVKNVKKISLKSENYKKIVMALKNFLVCQVSEWRNFVFNLTLLLLIFHLFTSENPDPYSEYGTGSTKLLITDPIWIRIRNIKQIVV